MEFNGDFNFTKIRTSWTKYDIVQVMEVVHSPEILRKYVDREAKMDGRILRSFLGMKSLDHAIPEYWIDIQKYPQEKKLFALFSVIFTHGEIVKKFAEEYTGDDMKGLFVYTSGKEYTNIRSALVESGAAKPYLRKAKEVPFDFSPIFKNFEVGKLFKRVLKERITRLTKVTPNDTDFYKICLGNNFHKAMGISSNKFWSWLEGIKMTETEDNYINTVKIANFHAIHRACIDNLSSAKEVYFVGENGDGKSLVLMAIYLTFNRFFVLEHTNGEKAGKTKHILNGHSSMELLGIDSRGKKYGQKTDGYLKDLYAYGPHRARYRSSNSESYGFMSLFDNDQTLMNPISWLMNQKRTELQEHGNTTLDPKNNRGAATLFSTSFLEHMFYGLSDKNVQIRIGYNTVTFIEKGTPLHFNQLSEGYRSMVIFVSDLLCRLSSSQPEVKKVKNLYGIVLVDEIDLHLHPKWQRVLVKKLRMLLPRVQFFFTTHSPIIIESASEDAVIYRVYRNPGTGETKISSPYLKKSQLFSV
ncbi:AAA family ATPase [Muricauda sp. SCSIO 64092]|uniref:AAA family ATPase n=1 Tax=Allomuricauda sp. SCSIO 64092 TaxID=2908842 RepID=UPI001FF16BC3|nr:AAA family ATPase [Muricauda sp. SCSIO 64092]UOY05336.1 AAA family ATPase [Muricauda sp. SCSIO 64092]